jgi:hypothetical protein
MDDLDLDRELRAAMAALPSVEFVARVRAKVADAPPPSIVPGWLKPAAAIACAAAIAIVVAVPLEDARLKPSPTEVAAGLKPSTTYAPSSPTSAPPGTVYVAPSNTYIASSDTQVLPKAVVVPTFPPSRGVGEVSPKFAGSVRTTADRAAEPAITPSPQPVEPPLPEVMVAAKDVEALRLFLNNAHDPRFAASFDPTSVSTAWAMNDLAVPPITIEPLDAAPARNN